MGNFVENLKYIWGKYKDQIYYAFAAALIISVAIYYAIPGKINDFTTNNSKIAEIQQKINDKEMEVEGLRTRNSIADRSKILKSLPVTVYKSPYTGVNIEAACVSLVDELVTMINRSGSKIIAISYGSAINGTASPPSGQVDPSVPQQPQTMTPTSGQQYGKLSLSFTLNGSYQALNSILQSIYTWRYLAAIKDITVEPDNGDYNNLKIGLTVVLFVKD